MKRTPKLVRALVGVSAVALLATACGGNNNGGGSATDTGSPSATETGTGGGETSAPAAGGTLSTFITEPRSLNPPDANESEGIAVVRALFTGLIRYDTKTSEPTQGVADSIDSPDNGKTWNITLQDGWTFHDGTAVTANSFVDAWNYAAYGPNAQNNASFFTDIEGYDDLQCGTTTQTADDGTEETVADCDNQPPAAETMSGLVVNDDTSFTVTLKEAQTFFETRLGYGAYMPLPQAFFDDPAGFNEQPIGNGPFMMKDAWQHDTVIETVKNPDYPLDQAKVDELDFRIYADVNTAVTDLLAGNLDIVDNIPPERFTEVQGQIGEDHTGKTPSSSINYIGLPMYLPWLGDNPDLRAALSLAIDNQQITDTIFEGLRQPAYNLFSPVIPAYQEKVCDNWGTDAAKAKELFDQAGGLDALPDKLEFWFNEGAGHENWVDAVTTQWQNVLGIPKDSWEFKTMQFAQYLEVEDSKSFTGPFRLGWGMDYPHPQNYTVPLLLITPADGGSNGTFYESQAFADKLNEALSIADIQEAIPVYQEAMKIVCEDVPVIPMFYGQNTFGFSDNVSNLYVDAFGDINYTEVAAKS